MFGLALQVIPALFCTSSLPCFAHHPGIVLFVIPALSRDPVHAAGLCKGLWCTLDPGSSPGMTKVPGMFQFHRARSTGDQVVPCLQVGLGFVLTGWGRDLCWPGGAGVGADEAVSAKADLDTPHGHYPTNARIAACAILSASTAKNRRSAARVSLRPKPSVPSVV